MQLVGRRISGDLGNTAKGCEEIGRARIRTSTTSNVSASMGESRNLYICDRSTA